MVSKISFSLSSIWILCPSLLSALPSIITVSSFSFLPYLFHIHSFSHSLLLAFPCPLILCQTSLNAAVQREECTVVKGCAVGIGQVSGLWRSVSPRRVCLAHLMWKGHSQDRASNASGILWQTLNLQQSAESLMLEKPLKLGKSLCVHSGAFAIHLLLC